MINEVRNSVLTILNKNNYGYISPSDFNLLAKNAQMELYEEYYSNYNKTMNAENMRTSGSDYADISKPLAEIMEYFIMSDFLVPKITPNSFPTNSFYMPSEITVGNNAYMINKVIVYKTLLLSGTSDTPIPYGLLDTNVDFQVSGISAGDIVVNTDTYQSATVLAVTGVDTLAISEDIFQDVGGSEPYSIYSGTAYSEAEKVSNNKILLLANSLLTAPSLIYPAYTNIGDFMTLYPTTIQGYGAVKADYFRYPKPPKWTYITLSGGEPVFDQSQSDYQDFELPTEDGYKLVTKILEYCGIVIREIEISQFGTAQQQHEQPTFSMQQ